MKKGTELVVVSQLETGDIFPIDFGLTVDTVDTVGQLTDVCVVDNKNETYYRLVLHNDMKIVVLKKKRL